MGRTNQVFVVKKSYINPGKKDWLTQSSFYIGPLDTRQLPGFFMWKIIIEGTNYYKKNICL